MALAIPLTEARPEAMRIATRFYLRMPHGLNQDFHVQWNLISEKQGSSAL